MRLHKTKSVFIVVIMMEGEEEDEEQEVEEEEEGETEDSFNRRMVNTFREVIASRSLFLIVNLLPYSFSPES